MIKFPFESKPLVIGALVVLIGAPTAGATMMARAKPAPAAAESAQGPLIQIELVAPKEPVVLATYPLETFDSAPVNEFKGRPPHGQAWRVGYEMDFSAPPMWAEPTGEERGYPSEAARIEQEARFEEARDNYLRAERARAVEAYEARLAAAARMRPLDDGDDPAG